MNNIDIAECEQEPIRFPGAVMPHGAVVVLRAGPTSLIDAVSDSCAPLLGMPPGDLLGRSFGELFGADALAAITAARQADLRPILRLSLNGRDLLARTSSNQDGQTLVDIEPPIQDAAIAYAIRHGCRSEMDRLRRL
ncbi:MAG TPA: hypothetical protein HPQ04_15055, partial [Rhodospirillaceae bacterium]|nr:hypothetical protein [Rhodospirillaceae bacterium]